ncbi:polymer-forming cytoskeletal protein [Marivita sp.]|uniref:bactofilin family protein n=1 Tax=Marivita sp. TaxID=2003365 RepID=UPI00343F46B6
MIAGAPSGCRGRHSASTTIRGQFRGKIAGGKVTLHPTAQVTGDIKCESLSIESGAQVDAEFRCIPYV